MMRLFILLYALSYLWVSNSVQFHSHRAAVNSSTEQKDKHCRHDHTQTEEDSNCAICFYIQTPHGIVSTLSYDLSYIAPVFSIAYQTDIANHALREAIFRLSNKGPPASIPA